MKNKTYIFLVLCIVSFIVLAFAYFTPVLSGKGLIQPDIVNYRGGAEELTQYRKTFEEDAYWTNSMFSGMPTYQAGAQYPMDFLKKIDATLHLYLARPVDYIFLFMSGFFLLGMVWTKNWKYALLGATMFGFSSYFFIILEAGHNGKAHAIAYFAPLFAGIYLLFKRNYFWGFILTTLFFALELMANHIQMTYYLFFAIGIFILTQLYFSIKDKQLKAFGISLGLFVTSSLFAVGMNSTRLLATYEYGKETTRGKSELVKKNNEKPSEGLEKDYITAILAIYELNDPSLMAELYTNNYLLNLNLKNYKKQSKIIFQAKNNIKKFLNTFQEVRIGENNQELLLLTKVLLCVFLPSWVCFLFH